jgi:hypothetical protein
MVDSPRKNCVLQAPRRVARKALKARAARKVVLQAPRTGKQVGLQVVVVGPPVVHAGSMVRVLPADRKAVPRVLRTAKVGPLVVPDPMAPDAPPVARKVLVALVARKALVARPARVDR